MAERTFLESESETKEEKSESSSFTGDAREVEKLQQEKATHTISNKDPNEDLQSEERIPMQGHSEELYEKLVPKNVEHMDHVQESLENINQQPAMTTPTAAAEAPKAATKNEKISTEGQKVLKDPQMSLHSSSWYGSPPDLHSQSELTQTFMTHPNNIIVQPNSVANLSVMYYDSMKPLDLTIAKGRNEATADTEDHLNGEHDHKTHAERVRKQTEMEASRNAQINAQESENLRGDPCSSSEPTSSNKTPKDDIANDSCSSKGKISLEEGKEASILQGNTSCNSDQSTLDLSLEHSTNNSDKDSMDSTLYTSTPTGKEKKKIKRKRTTFTLLQKNILTDEFNRVIYPDYNKLKQLSKTLDLPEETINTWFQNRRALKIKKEKTQQLPNGATSQEKPDTRTSMAPTYHTTMPLYHTQHATCSSSEPTSSNKTTPNQIQTQKDDIANDSCSSKEMTPLVEGKEGSILQGNTSCNSNHSTLDVSLEHSTNNSDMDSMDSTLDTSTPTGKEKKIRKRTSFTWLQKTKLIDEFKRDIYPECDKLDQLSETLNLPVETIKTWFQNRRALLRLKLKKEKTQQLPNDGMSQEKPDTRTSIPLTYHRPMPLYHMQHALVNHDQNYPVPYNNIYGSYVSSGTSGLTPDLNAELKTQDHRNPQNQNQL